MRCGSSRGSAGRAWDVLAWNRLAGRLAFDCETLPPADLNAARLVFLRPGPRELYPDWEEIASETVSALRAEVGHFPDHGRPHQVMCELRDASADVRRFWDAQDMFDRDHGFTRIANPEVGELVVTFEAFTVPSAPDQRLCTYTAPKGSDTERELRELATEIAVLT